MFDDKYNKGKQLRIEPPLVAQLKCVYLGKSFCFYESSFVPKQVIKHLNLCFENHLFLVLHDKFIKLILIHNHVSNYSY